MRRLIVLGAVCFSATMLLAQTQTRENSRTVERQKSVTPVLVPLNVKTGLWQMTETIKWINVPPEMAAIMNNRQPITYKSCVRPNHLNSNPWANGSHDNCTWTALKSTGTDMEVQATGCQLGENYGMIAEAHGTIHVMDSEDGTGSMDVTLTGNGRTMNGHASYKGMWIGATCPASMN